MGKGKAIKIREDTDVSESQQQPELSNCQLSWILICTQKTLPFGAVAVGTQEFNEHREVTETADKQRADTSFIRRLCS